MEKIQQLSDLIDEVLAVIKKLDVKALIFFRKSGYFSVST